ncbi:MAG: 4-hydroxy-tetrahydrodipicolinate synthase [Desulfobacteraceae bacterium 4572_130]|nr:MAG: 4-hydroxy-tetrahydrodipicolinate synthase [Desulfobacteraceae bacterium 4572_130]
MKTGCYTALITPFDSNGELDIKGLDQLISFQIKNNITGILAVGTTGESPTLKWDEHNKVVEDVVQKTRNKCFCIAGAGSNNTKESILAVKHAASAGADAVLLVDPYYNGPSSLEIRREYYEPIAEKFPNINIIPYIIPGRTGAKLLPQDLAILAQQYKNITWVKEATGDLDNMRHTRKCCGKDFTIMSGDDGLVFQMMTDPEIKALGVISVISNIAPKALTDMVMFLKKGEINQAEKLNNALKPLLELVTVITEEQTPFGKVQLRARNPLPLKTLMQILGLPSGAPRKPLGKITKNGLNIIVNAAKKVQNENPEIFEPLAEFFNVNVSERLDNPEYRKNLWYDY